MPRKAGEPKTTHRGFRIPDPLYEAAQAKAEGRGETLTAVVCAALERYVRAKGKP